MRREWDQKEWETLIERVQISLFTPEGHITRSEFSPTAIMLMLGAMQVSYFKYGPVAEGFPDRLNAIESMKKRLDWYLNGHRNPEGETLIEPGNVEYLIDAMNFLMIEFMYPRHPQAYFKATDRWGSPGRVPNSELYEGKPVQYKNTDIDPA